MTQTAQSKIINSHMTKAAMQAMLAEAWPEAKRRAEIIKSARYVEFQRTYESDPVAFVHDCIRWDGKRDDGPSTYQSDLLSHIPVEHRVSMRGPHGLGKSVCAAWAILWFALTRDGDDWKVPTMASKWRQLTLYLWPEIHKWSRRLKWSKIGREPFDDRHEIFNLKLELATGAAFAMATTDPTAIEGAHADRMLYVFDEAKSIPVEIFDSAEGAFSTAGVGGTEAFAIAVSTPGEPRGRFYDIHSRKSGYEDWWVRAVSKAEAIAAGRITEDWAVRRAKQWGKSSPIYINRVEGNFAESSILGIISVSSVEDAVDRWNDWNHNGRRGTVTHIGVDVGRGGNQSVVSTIYDAGVVGEIRRNDIADIMHTTGIVSGLLQKHTSAVAVVDVIGLGAGVVDRLRELFDRDRVVAFNAGERTNVKDKTGELGFVDKRSAAWWKMKERLEGDLANVAFPEDDFLLAELTTPRYAVTSTGKIKVESKDDVKGRLDGRSTDSADSIIQALVGTTVTTGSYSWSKSMSQ